MSLKKMMPLLLIAGAIMSPTAQAAEILTVNLNASHYLRVNQDITRVAIGSPDIIGVVELKPSLSELLVVAKKAGTTSLLIWTVDGRMLEYSVHVSPEDKGSAAIIERAINLPHVRVKKVDNRILLTGKVNNQNEREYAIKTAQLYVGNVAVSSISNGNNVGAVRHANVSDQISNQVRVFEGASNSGGGEGSSAIIDLLEIEFPTQVKFEAQIIEIGVEDAKNLGFQYYSSPNRTADGVDDAVGGAGTFYGGETWNTDRNRGFREFRNNPVKWFFAQQAPLNMTINALVSKGKAKILSRPNIATMSGEAASIHIGGEIPIPIDDDGKITYEYKPYGVILKIVPNVDANNKITSDVTAIISDLDYTRSITISGTRVPGFRSREANAVINVEPGMTMAIGGLLTSDDNKTITKVPLLGDIPILGEFFKHTSREKVKQELMILITPTLVNEYQPVRMSEELESVYNESRQLDEARNEVDLNETEPPQEDLDEQKILNSEDR